MGRAVALLAAVAIAAGCSNNGSGDKAVIVQECKDSVQSHLSYDADWPFFDPAPVKDSGGIWHVSGSVGVQNGFGAKRTLRWNCTVTSDDVVTTNVG